MNHSDNCHAKQTPRPAGNYVRMLASYLVAGGCLFWVFHNIHFDQMWQSMARIRWWLVGGGIVLEFLAYFCVAWEWQLLLRPTGRLPLPRAVQAVFAGRFANDALPLQLGYFVRAILAARRMDVSIVSIFPSLIVERLWDGIWLAAGIGLAALLLPLPPAVLQAADIFGATVLAGTAATIAVVWLCRGGSRENHPVQPDSKWRFIQQLRLAFHRLVDGVRDIGRSGRLAPILGLSFLKLALQAAAFLGFLWAYRLDLPVPVGLTVFLAGYLGICVPSTPAGTGMFQLFVVGALTLFGVGKSIAAGFALTAFVAITVPLAVAGFFALAQSGLRLRQIQVEADQSKKPA